MTNALVNSLASIPTVRLFLNDDGYQALFASLFVIEELSKIECPGRPLSPVGIKCVLRKE